MSKTHGIPGAVLTPEGRARLEAELHELRTVGRARATELVQTAREESRDWADGAALAEAHEEQLRIETRIAELEWLLSSADTLEAPAASDGTVRLGSTVTIKTDDGEVDAYTLVGPAEAMPRAGRISYQSPVGRALLGARVGDEVAVDTPAGRQILRVIAVE
jgi:transcription elongation factor GreA